MGGREVGEKGKGLVCRVSGVEITPESLKDLIGRT